MYYYTDENNNLIKSSRILRSKKLFPITQEEYETAMESRTAEED